MLASHQLLVDEGLSMAKYKDDPRLGSMLEKRLLDIIVKYKYYRDIQLRTLFDECRKTNKIIDSAIVEASIINVQRILDE